MRKHLLISLLACIFSPSMLAQVRYFEWIDPKTTLRVKLEPDTHELWKEVKGGVWVKSNAVSFNDKIVEDLPINYSVHSAFYTGDSVITFTLHGMGNVYAYKVNTQTLERLDHSFYKGYNFSSTEFIRQDTLFSFGGYGFWHFNNTQTFFDKKHKEWFLYKSKNKGPETIKGGLQGYDATKDVFYSGLGFDDPRLIGGKKENSSTFYLFDFKTKEWVFLGKLNGDLTFGDLEREMYWNGRYFICWSTTEFYIIDPRANKVYGNKTMDIAFNSSSKFYTKGDSLIHYSSDGSTIWKYSIKKMLEESKTDLSKFTSKNPNTNKNRIIEELTTQVNILKNSIVKFQEAQKGKIASNLINSNIIALQTGGQSNSKQIQMRTFNLLKHKKYYEYPFIAERPIIAAHNAYDFLKLHDKISRKQIIFSIYDIVNNKKYRYIAKTLKDGKNVIKSAK